MLKRQGFVLVLLEESQAEQSLFWITKLSFLSSVDFPALALASFYSFCPYKYGPYSFALKRELENLARDGYVNESKNGWQLSAHGRKTAREVSPDLIHIARAVVHKYGRLTKEELTRQVYDRFPWFTVNSKIERAQERSVAQVAVYTVGYQGLSIDEFLNGVLFNGIQCVIDVRRNPLSRNFGYHKSTLSHLLDNVGVSYVHFPELGVPSERRSRLESQTDYRRLFDWYDDYLMTKAIRALESVRDRMTSCASVLLCQERSPQECHRSILARHISKATALPVQNLSF